MIILPKLILASGSPRRAEILRSVGWEFIKVVPDIDESELANESPETYVQRLAREKAEAVRRNNGDGVILAADTTVVVDEQIIGKPIDMDDARRMLRMLAGRRHEVLTGVAVLKDGDMRIGLQRTSVKFAELTEAEVNFLAEMGDRSTRPEPMPSKPRLPYLLKPSKATTGTSSASLSASSIGY